MPFALREGATAQGLAAAVERPGAARAPFRLPSLAVERLGDFPALVPVARESRIGDLAADRVRKLDCFRAPPLLGVTSIGELAPAHLAPGPPGFEPSVLSAFPLLGEA